MRVRSRKGAARAIEQFYPRTNADGREFRIRPTGPNPRSRPSAFIRGEVRTSAGRSLGGQGRGRHRRYVVRGQVQLRPVRRIRDGWRLRGGGEGVLADVLDVGLALLLGEQG